MLNKIKKNQEIQENTNEKLSEEQKAKLKKKKIVIRTAVMLSLIHI